MLNQCYLCGGVECSFRPGSVRDDPDVKILECNSCGLVFLSSFDHIEDHFYKSSGMHGKETLDVSVWLKETEWDDMRRFKFLKYLLPNCLLLDYGCGAGGFLLKAREIAKDVHGVELESRLDEHFQSQGISVFSNISEISNEVGGYDSVTLFHVLEHLPDPKSILVSVSKLIKDDGQIIVEVPNADDALLTFYNNEPFSHFTYWSCHLFLFTVKTLSMLISQCDLKVNYIKQLQRYPLSNHLFWLSKGRPGGHKQWHFLDSKETCDAYERQLAAIGKCDTLIASISKK